MREILFKAKRKDNGEWVEGGYFLEPYTDKDFIICWNSFGLGFNEFIEIDTNTLCQFTGLNDENGKKIWENDIVRCKKSIDGNLIDYCIEYGYVEMKHGAFGLHRKQGYYRPFKDWLEDYEYEVIGNIFDNAELLEVE